MSPPPPGARAVTAGGYPCRVESRPFVGHRGYEYVLIRYWDGDHWGPRRAVGADKVLTRREDNVDFTASNGGAGSYEKPKPGSYYGILIGFADLGSHTGQYGTKRRVMLRWELHRRRGPALDSNGEVLTTTAIYNASFDVKSTLRAVVEAHTGQYQDGAKVRSVDWLDRPARLALKESDDGKYVNVDAVTPLDPEEDEVPTRRGEVEHWEMGQDDEPPAWCKWMVVRSAEWKGRNGQGDDATRATAVAVGGDDDDIPF